jgi:hypothetical protein
MTRPVDTAAALPSYTPRESLLKKRSVRSGSQHLHGRSALALGAFLIGVVVVTLGVTADEISAFGLAYRHAGWWFRVNIVAGVTIFAIAMVVRGVRDIYRTTRLQRRRAANARQPWHWDYEWDDRGIHDDPVLHQAGRLIAWTVGLLGYAVPLHFAAAAVSLSGRDLTSIIILWLPVWLGLVGVELLAIVLGGRALKLHVRAPGSLPQHAVATATLRCIQEREVTTEGRNGQEHTNIQCFELYRDTAPAEPVATDANTRALRVRFVIPADAPTTDLTSRPCRYWEVEIEAPTDGVDYGARFLVPVY